MTPTARAAGAVIVAALLLLGSAACQNDDPDPIPTATLPTPERPSSSSSIESVSPDRPTDQAITEAAQSYLEGRVLAEDLYKTRSPDRLPELGSYFTDEYLEFWETDLASYIEADLEYTGEVKLSVASAQNYRDDQDEPKFELVTCLSFSEVEWIDSTGSEIEKPFENAIEDVTVVESSEGRWLASSAKTEPIESFTGTQCEGTL